MRVTSILAALGLILCGVASAVAEDTGDPTKWSQLPDMGAYGYSFSSETVVPSVVADDFLCSSLLPVVDVHWWGSYYDAGALRPYPNSDNHTDPTLVTGQAPGILQGFVIEFWTDIPGGMDPSMPWSHPGTLLYGEFIPVSQVAEALYGTVTHVGGMQENVWQYNCDLPRPFFQEPYSEPQDVDGDGVPDGTVYWLKIQAVHQDAVIQWGWHEAETLWHDNAVQNWPPNPNLPVWNQIPDTDMAFELTVIPEPSMLLVLGMGVLALLRRR
jgi:hypothetical protein